MNVSDSCTGTNAAAGASGSVTPNTLKGKRADCMKFSSRGPLRSPAAPLAAADESTSTASFNAAGGASASSTADRALITSLSAAQPTSTAITTTTAIGSGAPATPSRLERNGAITTTSCNTTPRRTMAANNTGNVNVTANTSKSPSRTVTPKRTTTSNGHHNTIGATPPVRGAARALTPNSRASPAAGAAVGSTQQQRSPSASSSKTPAKRLGTTTNASEGRSTSPTTVIPTAATRTTTAGSATKPAARPLSAGTSRSAAASSPPATSPKQHHLTKKTTTGETSKKATSSSAATNAHNTSVLTEDSVIAKYDPIRLLLSGDGAGGNSVTTSTSSPRVGGSRAVSPNVVSRLAMYGGSSGTATRTTSGAVGSPKATTGGISAASPRSRNASPHDISRVAVHATHETRVLTMQKALAAPVITPRDNHALRTRRSHSADREQQALQYEAHQALLNNNASVGVVIREARRSVTPNGANAIGAVHASSSPLAASAVRKGASHTAGSPPSPSGGGTAFSSRRGASTNGIVGGPSAAKGLSSPAGTRGTTTVSSGKTKVGGSAANRTPNSTRCTTAKGATVITSDYGTAVTYARPSTNNNTNDGVAKVLSMDESNVGTHHNEGAEDGATNPATNPAPNSTNPKAAIVEDNAVDHHQHAPSTIPLQCRGSFTPLRNTFTPRGKHHSKLVYDEVAMVRQRQQEEEEGNDSPTTTTKKEQRSGSIPSGNARRVPEVPASPLQK